MAEIKVEGLNEILRKFEQLPVAVEKRILGRAMKDGLVPMRNAVERAAPDPSKVKEPEHKHIKDNIVIRPGKRKRGQVTYVVVADVPHAAAYEYGHHIGKGATNETIGVTKGKRRTAKQRAQIAKLNAARAFVPPHPFARPAFDQFSETVVERTAEVFGALVTTEAAKRGISTAADSAGNEPATE